jgi:hypothetical protein
MTNGVGLLDCWFHTVTHGNAQFFSLARFREYP